MNWWVPLVVGAGSSGSGVEEKKGWSINWDSHKGKVPRKCRFKVLRGHHIRTKPAWKLLNVALVVMSLLRKPTIGLSVATHMYLICP